MRVLLDTHVLLWGLLDDPRLPERMRAALDDDGLEKHLSAASIWEIAIKRAVGKLATPAGPIVQTAFATGCRPLSVTWAHAEAAGQLPRHHADPFDRMLIAQGQIERLTVMTLDSQFRHYDLVLF